MKKATKIALIMAWLFGVYNASYSQQTKESKTSVVAWDGMIATGYVNHGGYVNFGGPSLKLIRKPWSIGFGILPTMRIKKDKVAEGAKKNSAITPTAGFGFTLGFRHLVVQVPFYYNPKTSTTDGQWYPGIGIGFKL